jgi:hypothetical protein
VIQPASKSQTLVPGARPATTALALCIVVVDY